MNFLFTMSNLVDFVDSKSWYSILFAMSVAIIVNLISHYLIIRLMQKSDDDNANKIIAALKNK